MKVMGTVTTLITVGHADRYHGGITPLYQLYLYENDVPHWVLTRRCNCRDLEHLGIDIWVREAIWVPTVEHILEDGLLMIAAYIVKDEDICKLVNEYFKPINGIFYVYKVPKKVKYFKGI